MLYDVHTHAFHPKIARKVLAQLNGHYGITAVGDGTVEDLLARAKNAGLDRVAVHTAATTPDQVIPAINWSLHLKKTHPEIVAFGTVHPDHPHWEADLDRLYDAGIVGIKIHPDFQGFRLDDPRLGPIFEAMSGRFTVMVHVGDRLPPGKNPSCPFSMAKVQHDHPGLAMIAAHFGGYLHWKWSLEALAGTMVYMDTSSTLAHADPGLIRQILDRHPRERMLFGSDYPLFDPAREMQMLCDKLGLVPREVDELAGNAHPLLERDRATATAK